MHVFGFASIHSFYPNMSNFLQQRFGFNNEDAGHIASLPFILAGVSTPFIGIVLSKIGSSYYEIVQATGAAIIFTVHFSLFIMSDAIVGSGPKYLAILPITLFGLGHAIFATIGGPLVK